MEKQDFSGWKDCVRLANGEAELIVVTAVGPRILRYGFLGGPNAFHVLPETQGQTGGGKWLPYGGHRLWHAPEVKPRTYAPDNGPVETVAWDGRTLRLAAPPEQGTGIAKEMGVTLAPRGTAVRVEHQLTNHGLWPVTLAPWALSIVANGGRVVLPQEPWVSHDDDLLPARPLVLWKFTDMADPRWRWGTRFLSLCQNDVADRPQKAGLYNSLGWAAHLTAGQVFVVQIDVAPGGPAALADGGCNFETYTDGPFHELETLGPLQTLEPGQTARHTEHWFLGRSPEIADTDAELEAHLLPLVAQARREAAALR